MEQNCTSRREGKASLSCSCMAGRYRVIAPDLRGFGDSDKPSGPFGANDHAADLMALLDQLRIETIGVVGYDVGGAAMLPLTRKASQRISGLFFFDFVYPGIGPRMGAPDRLNEIWYQSFNQMEMAPALVGPTREPGGRFCTLQSCSCGTHRDDQRRSAGSAADRSADLCSLA